MQYSDTENTSRDELWELGMQSIRDLEVEQGVLASGRKEIYGCVFGRDSLITALELIEAYRHSRQDYFLELVRKILIALAALQGREVNIQSGEEPGKIVHEYRPEGHEHLTQNRENPWYLYPDNVLRNFDSVDSTPLFLMAVDAYVKASGDEVLLEKLLPSVHDALAWMLEYGDSNGDGFIDYHLHPERTYGGLITQSWMDSSESLFYEEDPLGGSYFTGRMPLYPIAPVEVQAYAWVSMRVWSDHFAKNDPGLSYTLATRAKMLKERFNAAFPLNPGSETLSLAFALEGEGRPLTSGRSSMGHVLWAAYRKADGSMESILEEKFIEPLRNRLLQSDLFVEGAGIRTLSSESIRFNFMSYHNGSIWPHDTAILAQGLEHFGFRADAARVRQSLLRAYLHFGTPVELFAWDKQEFKAYELNGQKACQVQAWSAASLLAALAASSDATQDQLTEA